MKRFLIILSLLCTSLVNYAQEQYPIIEVPYSKDIHLVFDTDIVFGDPASKDVIFDFKDNKARITAAIEAFEETNLMVQTKDGYYMFVIRYKADPKNFLYFFKKEDAILKKDQIAKVKDSNKVQSDSLLELKMVSEGIFNRTPGHTDWGVSQNKMTFGMSDLFVKNKYMIFRVYLNNSSSINYDIDNFSFVIKSGHNTVKKATEQEEHIKPIYTYNEEATKVEAGKYVVKVFVFEKFTINDKKKLYISCVEKQGDRRLTFTLNQKDLLNAKFY